MKNLLSFTLMFLFVTSISVAQNTINFAVASVNIEKVTTDVQSYVDIQMAKWKKRGIYETSEDYTKRQTPLVLLTKTEEYRSSKINEIADKIIHLAVTNFEYVADSQAFKMVMVGLPDLYLRVPAENGEAFIFEKNMDKISFENPVFNLDQNGFVVAELDVRNNFNQKVYHYPYTEPLAESEIIETKPEPVAVAEKTVEPIMEVVEEEPVRSANYVEMPKVGMDLPASTKVNPNAVAVVIGNSEYQHTSNVKYAVNDAELMKKYLIEVLGYREANVFFEKNITKGTFENYFGTRDNSDGKLSLYVKREVSDVFVYYAGHGFPDKDGNVYFLPNDAEPNIVQLGGYPMSVFYNNLTKLKAKSVTIILDACFSGFGIQRSVSGVRIVEDVKEEIPNGSIMTSSSASQESTWLDQEEHGMFTYFFMRALHDKELADVNQDRKLTIGEIFDYVSNTNEGVPYYARRINQLDQTPEFKGDREKVMLEY